MPLDLIVISLMRTSKWINVLMVNTPGEVEAAGEDNPQRQRQQQHQQRRIDVRPNGIRWIEPGFEQFTPLGKFFEINANPESGITMNKDLHNSTAMKLSLHTINDKALDRKTKEVRIKELRLLWNESMACALHCSHCQKELVAVQRFSRIRPMPICTMMPHKYFCPNDKGARPTLAEGELYYALNYIVISPKILGRRVIRNKGHIHCGRCLQLVGESLGEAVAVQMYVDTLSLAPKHHQNKMRLPMDKLEQLFGRLSVSQLMLHLLHDAVPISEEKTRLFLKTVRPDGQLHYMLLLVDTRQLHLLRSKMSRTPLVSSDSSSESGSCNSNMSTSDDDDDDDVEDVDEDEDVEDAHDDLVKEPHEKRQRVDNSRPVQVMQMQGYRGSRVNYRIFLSDEELAAHDDLIEQWRSEGTPILRISYMMMMSLLHELKSNELLVATLEGCGGNIKGAHTSYIIYVPDEDI